MSFTTITVTGKYLNNDGTPCIGSIVFTLSATLQDSTDKQTRPAVPSTVRLDATGSFSINLVANDDPTTSPSGSTYIVTEHINGVIRQSYNVSVPHSAAGGTIDISQLAPVINTQLNTYALLTGATFTGTVQAPIVDAGGQVFNVKAYGAKGDGVTLDTPAFILAYNAAKAAGGAATVYMPHGTYNIGGSLSLSGYSSGLQGCGPGSVLLATGQTGAVLNLTGFVTQPSFLSGVEFGNFSIQGDGTADPTKNTKIGLSIPALANAAFRNISISQTGGYGLYLGNGAEVCEFDKVTVEQPISANTNNVAYVYLAGATGNRFDGLGLRSVSTASDPIDGVLRIWDDGAGNPANQNTFENTWFEFIHIPTNGCVISHKSNSTVFSSTQIYDTAPATGATGTSFARFLPPVTGSDFGGSFWFGMVPGSSYGVGIELGQSRNAIYGSKGFNGANIVIDSGITASYVVLAGASSGSSGTAGITDNSNTTTNVYFDGQQPFFNWAGLQYNGTTGTITVPTKIVLGSNRLPIVQDASSQFAVQVQAHLTVQAGNVFAVGTDPNSTIAMFLVCNTDTQTAFVCRAHSPTQNGALAYFENSSGVILSAVNPDGSFKPAHIADASAINDSFYYSTTLGKLVYKDGSGVVNALY